MAAEDVAVRNNRVESVLLWDCPARECAEGWHLTEEPDQTNPADSDDLDDDEDLVDNDEDRPVGKRVRSTRRRQDVPDLPRMRCDPRTVGRVFTTPEGKQYRPSMFLTATLKLPQNRRGIDYKESRAREAEEVRR